MKMTTKELKDLHEFTERTLLSLLTAQALGDQKTVAGCITALAKAYKMEGHIPEA